MQHGIRKYARAVEDIGRMRDKGLPVLPHQQTALARAREALDQVRPDAGRDAAAAFNRQPEFVVEAASGKTARTVQAMQLEARARINPEMRADRFVENWQQLGRQRDMAMQSGHHDRTKAITASMGHMAKALERDPQVESILHNHKMELGLRGSGGGIAHELTQYLGLGRGRGIGM
ncbi:hypothetical protein GCM10009096_16360 [Parasphingorhabdus litoris]|uniref:Conjugal transfer protein TraA n=1 Tax=Parasphingorhabdus litoris TaxID=394733 RepID=A0ABN1AFS0_9SPHN